MARPKTKDAEARSFRIRIDIRGVATNPSSQLFGLTPDFEQVVEMDTDTTVYSISKIVKLLMSCNPNTIEMLGCRPQDYIYKNDFGRRLLDNKDAFLSKRAIESKAKQFVFSRSYVMRLCTMIMHILISNAF